MDASVDASRAPGDTRRHHLHRDHRAPSERGILSKCRQFRPGPGSEGGSRHRVATGADVDHGPVGGVHGGTGSTATSGCCLAGAPPRAGDPPQDDQPWLLEVRQPQGPTPQDYHGAGCPQAGLWDDRTLAAERGDRRHPVTQGRAGVLPLRATHRRESPQVDDRDAPTGPARSSGRSWMIGWRRTQHPDPARRALAPGSHSSAVPSSRTRQAAPRTYTLPASQIIEAKRAGSRQSRADRSPVEGRAWHQVLRNAVGGMHRLNHLLAQHPHLGTRDQGNGHRALGNTGRSVVELDWHAQERPADAQHPGPPAVPPHRSPARSAPPARRYCARASPPARQPSARRRHHRWPTA